AIFDGLAAAVVAIVAAAMVSIGGRAVRGMVAAVVAALAFLAIFVIGFPFPIIVLAAAATGLALGPRRLGVTVSDEGTDRTASLAPRRRRDTTGPRRGTRRVVDPPPRRRRVGRGWFDLLGRRSGLRSRRGAPWVERLRTNRALRGALAAVTAAVVGVIGSLALTVAANVLFEDVQTARPFFAAIPRPVWSSLDVPSVVVGTAAFVAIRRFRVNVAWVALGGGLVGLVLGVVR